MKYLPTEVYLNYSDSDGYSRKANIKLELKRKICFFNLKGIKQRGLRTNVFKPLFLFSSKCSFTDPVLSAE